MMKMQPQGVYIYRSVYICDHRLSNEPTDSEEHAAPIFRYVPLKMNIIPIPIALSPVLWTLPYMTWFSPVRLIPP
jgi:hypothetical protein